MQAPWPLSEKWWRSKREMKDKAKQQKAKKLYKKFMKEKAPAEDSFSHPFYLRCLPVRCILLFFFSESACYVSTDTRAVVAECL